MAFDLPPGGAPPAPNASLRGAVIHLNNEQPVVVDLFEFPTARDVTVICTNMRTQDGKRPIFIDHAESVFVIPMAYVRFIELSGALAPGAEAGEAGAGRSRSGAPAEAEIEIDEDFLRRIRDA